MANIPVGNFGRSTPGQVSPGSAAGDFGQGMARAIQGLGQTISAIGDYREQQKTEMARAKAVNEVYRYESDLMSVVDNLGKRQRNGEIPYQELTDYYDKEIAAVAPPKIDGLDPASVEHFNGITARNAAKYRQTIGQLRDAAEQNDYRNQFESMMDNIGKQTQFSGADIAEINSKYAIPAEFGRRAKLDPAYINKRIQDAQDNNWFEHINNKAMQFEVSDNVQGLQKLKHDLTADDGAYVGKMDTSKRNAILSGVLTSLDRIEQRQLVKAQAQMQYASAAVKEVGDIVYAGGTPSKEKLAQVQQVVSGTPYEADLNQHLSFADRFASIKKMPANQQIQFAEQLRQQAYNSADSKAEIDTAERISRAVKENVKTMKEDTLTYLKQTHDIKLPPLPLDALTDPSQAADAADAISSMLTERQAYISAVAEQNGITIDAALLDKNEKDQVLSLLNTDKEPTARISALRALRAASPSVDAYKSILKQVENESPVLAQSGLWAASDRNISYSAGWFGSKKVTISPTVVADTILKGARIVDEKIKPVPKDSKFREKFDAYVGNAYANNVGAYKSDYETVRAYYVGKANEKTLSAESIDTDIINEALSVVVGGVHEAGDTKVIAPHGMPKDEFEDKLEAAWNSERGRLGKSRTPLSIYGLMKIPGYNSRYAVMSGTAPLRDNQARPVILDVGE